MNEPQPREAIEPVADSRPLLARAWNLLREMAAYAAYRTLRRLRLVKRGVGAPAWVVQLEERIEYLRARADEYGRNRPVNVVLKFAQRSLEQAEDLRAEVYVAHGVQALPAAASLARQTGGRYFCDAIEIPSFTARAVPTRWHSTNVDILDHAFESYLRHADGILTIGPALAGELRRLNERVHVIPNYRYAEECIPSRRLRELCGLREQDELVLSISTVATGFEVVLEALALLPAHVHLATIGKFVPPSYADHCMKLAAELDIASRVHCMEPVPYAELTSLASAADVGLIVRDPSIPNNFISLPNRIFDYMFAGVPICTPEIPDIARIVRDWRMGAVIGELTAAEWAAGIRQVLADKATLRHNAAQAGREHVWESLEEPLYAALGRPRSVCYLGINSLSDNNRTMRMARTLAARGVAVVVCSQRERDGSVTRNTVPSDGVRLVTIDTAPG